MPRARLLAPLLLLVASLARGAEPHVERQLAYGAHEAQTLDYYAPGVERPPLLAFVHSRLWSRADDGRQLDAHFARPLQVEGVAVAVIRHRLAPEFRHPAAAEDVAAALAYLLRHAGRLGFDPGRVYLGGHSSGAHLAALLALDPGYLEEAGLAPGRLAGVVALSGIYDLDPEEDVSPEEMELYEQAFGGGRSRRRASPLRHARPDAPRFLVLNAEHDIPGYRESGIAFAEALRASGHPDAESYFLLGRDHATILDMRDPQTGAPMHVLNFMRVRPLPPILAELDEATRYWRKPRFSTEPLWELGAKVESHPADERFLEEARGLFAGLGFKKTWSAERFHAIDLFDLLEALEQPSGRWLTLTNAQQERIYLDLEAVRPYRPVVVVGVDDERNLFTVTDLHRAKRAYSWRDDVPRPAYSIRPMGAFLYFLEPPEERLVPFALAHFSLDAGSFDRGEEDPLAPLRSLDPEVLEVVTTGNGCVSCHALRGVGPRAGHLRARDAVLQGGFALPLAEYPPEVWRRFVFEQEEAAAAIGASANPVPEPAATKLYELVVREREAARED